MPEYLTPQQVDAMLMLPPGTAKRRARRGQIPAFEIGGYWRIPKDEFMRWLAERGTKPSPRGGGA